MINQLRDRANRRLLNFLDLETSRITALRERPVLKDPIVLISTRQEVVAGLRDRSHRSTSHAVDLAREELLHIFARVRSLSPQSTLDRGYSVVQRSDGSIARDPKVLAEGERLRIRLALGEIGAAVETS